MANYINGIDVSKYQGDVDWATVKAHGIEFAFIRMGYINGDGTITVDPYYERNMKAAPAHVRVGVYLYNYARTPAAARIAATKALALLEPYNVCAPVALDHEHAQIYSHMTKSQNIDICNAFLDVVKGAGRTPIIYTYYSFAKSYLDLECVHGAIWLANYTGKIGIDNVDIWQYTSKGNVPGIKGNVDMNRAYNNFWGRIPEDSKDNILTPVQNITLEVFGNRKCEYFNSLDVNDVAGVLPSGSRHAVVELGSETVGGFSWATITMNGTRVYVALLDDRCRVVDEFDSAKDKRIAELEEQVSGLTEALATVKTELSAKRNQLVRIGNIVKE